MVNQFNHGMNVKFVNFWRNYEGRLYAFSFLKFFEEFVKKV
jgi:hypothetical protein